MKKTILMVDSKDFKPPLSTSKPQSVLNTSSTRKRVHHSPHKNALACALARRACIRTTSKRVSEDFHWFSLTGLPNLFQTDSLFVDFIQLASGRFPRVCYLTSRVAGNWETQPNQNALCEGIRLSFLSADTSASSSTVHLPPFESMA